MTVRFTRAGNITIIRSKSGKLIGSIEFDKGYFFKPISGYKFSIEEQEQILDKCKELKAK